MSELVDWIGERLDEDEATARATLDYYDPLDWGIQPVGEHGAWHMDGPVDGPSGYGALIVDPARVLAEVNAKRAIVAEHRRADWDVQGHATCETCVSPDDWTAVDLPAHLIYPCRTLRLLASVWVDAPGFREEWRP